MISGQELFAERERIKTSLDRSLSKAYENGMDLAEKTRLYRILLAKTILQLKADGMAVSIIKEVAKGTETVADAEMLMIAAEVAYKASNENIMAQKKLLESIEADINREFYKGE